jgi:hypothetical protein
MAIEIRRKDGRERYYYKETGGKSIPLGTKDEPNAGNVRKCYVQFKRTKDRVLKEEQIFNTLLAAIEKAD